MATIARKPRIIKSSTVEASPAPLVEATTVAVIPAPKSETVTVSTVTGSDAIKAIRKDRQAILVRHAGEAVVDAIDTVGNVARSIRAGVEDSATVGRMDAVHAIASAADALAKAGAPAGKVAAFKWGLLARVASAKRK